MKMISYAFVCLGIVLGLAAATPAHALNFHSFVSANGSGSVCTFTAPCADFSSAVAATTPGGIVSCVDQGANSFLSGFAVDRSIPIDCAGTAAAAFNVTVNGPGIVVTLRNLQINSVGASSINGIDFQNGAELNIEHCVIDGWNGSGGAGIHFVPASGTAELHVTDSFIRNNGAAGAGAGIFVAPTGGAQARVTVDRSVVTTNSNGIFANGTGGTVLVEVKDSMIANNKTNGVWAFTGGSQSVVVLDQSASVSNGSNGVVAQGNGAFVSLNGTTVNWNATGLTASDGGFVVSYQNNQVAGNLSHGVSSVKVGLE